MNQTFYMTSWVAFVFKFLWDGPENVVLGIFSDILVDMKHLPGHDLHLKRASWLPCTSWHIWSNNRDGGKDSWDCNDWGRAS